MPWDNNRNMVNLYSNWWIINLSPLNQFIPAFPFKMETQATIRTALKQEDWTTAIYLKDAYFHIPIHQSSKRYLRFVWEETSYQFQALCFGLCTAPYPFTRVFRLVSALAHKVLRIPLSRRLAHHGPVKGKYDQSHGVQSKEEPITRTKWSTWKNQRSYPRREQCS